VFDYDDPASEFIPGTVTKVDQTTWDTWAGPPGVVGATSLNAVNPSDVLYVSYGPLWVNIDWTKVKAGDKIQIKTPDGVTLQQDWTASAAFIPQAPGGHVAVSSVAGPFIAPSWGAGIRVLWIH
jgi:hypothetical protein